MFFGIHVAYPLYQTMWLLALAYAALFLPLAVGAVGAAPRRRRRRWRRSPGRWAADPAYVLRTVTAAARRARDRRGDGAGLPHLHEGTARHAAAAARPGLDTLATELWTQTSVGAYAAAAPYAVLLVAIAAVPTWWLSTRTGVSTAWLTWLVAG